MRARSRWTTSGSVTDLDVSQFSAEISSILEVADTTLTVIYCDKKIQNVERFERYDLPIQIHPMGGGGTDFRPTFKWIEDNRMNLGYLNLFNGP